MLRWATSQWLRVVTSKRMETAARKALVEALCISLSPLRWPIQMFESWKLMLILKVMLKMPNGCTVSVYGFPMHLSFTFDVVNILMLWCCSCWLLVERVTPAHQCLTVLYQISRASQRSSLWEHTDAKKQGNSRISEMSFQNTFPNFWCRCFIFFGKTKSSRCSRTAPP